MMMLGALAIIVADKLYFALRFPECKSCGWITKKDGKCCGCGSNRTYRWE